MKTLIHSPVTLVLLAIGILWSAPAAAQTNINKLIKQLESSDSAVEAITGLEKFAAENQKKRDIAVEKLIEVAKSSENIVQRGWAIAALGQIGGQDVDEMLLNIHADEKHEEVVRAWAAAARVSMTKTTAGLIEKANLVSQFPALGRPIGLRLVEQISKDDSVGVGDIIGVTLKVPQLNQALAPAIMAFGKGELVTTMVTASDQNVRRTAAAYVATLAQQGEGGIAEPVIEVYKFDKDAEHVPWKDGPLFLPSISWGKEDARALVGNLIRWLVFCDQKDDAASIRQIHNNIRSLGLAKAAGYESPGWNDVGTSEWLVAWGKAMGREEIVEILSEQGIAMTEYEDVLKRLE